MFVNGTYKKSPEAALMFVGKQERVIICYDDADMGVEVGAIYNGVFYPDRDGKFSIHFGGYTFRANAIQDLPFILNRDVLFTPADGTEGVWFGTFRAMGFEYCKGCSESFTAYWISQKTFNLIHKDTLSACLMEANEGKNAKETWHVVHNAFCITLDPSAPTLANITTMFIYSGGQFYYPEEKKNVYLSHLVEE